MKVGARARGLRDNTGKDRINLEDTTARLNAAPRCDSRAKSARVEFVGLYPLLAALNMFGFYPVLRAVIGSLEVVFEMMKKA